MKTVAMTAERDAFRLASPSADVLRSESQIQQIVLKESLVYRAIFKIRRGQRRPLDIDRLDG